MQLPAIIFSALFAGIGAMAVLLPDTVVEIARSLATPTGLLVAAALRAGFGVVLLMAAAESRAPNLLRLFGAVALIAGLSTPLFGVELSQRLLTLVSTEGGALLRVFGTIAIALGCSFVWALSPRQSMPRRQ
jgi:uncharacterized protein YjeT (DUF2065 family)